MSSTFKLRAWYLFQNAMLQNFGEPSLPKKAKFLSVSLSVSNQYKFKFSKIFHQLSTQNTVQQSTDSHFSQLYLYIFSLSNRSSILLIESFLSFRPPLDNGRTSTSLRNKQHQHQQVNAEREENQPTIPFCDESAAASRRSDRRCPASSRRTCSSRCRATTST